MSFRPAAAFRTHRRFRIGPAPEGFRDLYIAALDDNAFHDSISPADKSQRVGWCDVADPLRTGFSDVNRWLFSQYATFAMRVDEKKLPGKLFRAHLDKRVQAWCAANNRERCPSTVKAELKDLLEFEMLSKTHPKMDTYPVLWNLNEGWVIVGCTSTTRLDTFRKLFHRTFGMALSPADPLDLVPADLGCALLDTKGMDLRPGPGVTVGSSAPPDDVEEVEGGEPSTIAEEEQQCPPHLASEFALWAWWRAREGRGSIDLGENGSAEYWLDERIDFREVGEEKTVASVGGGDPSASGVAMAALAEGCLVKSIGLCIRREDREYSLRLTGPLLHRSGVKLPALVKSGDDGEQLYEAGFLFEELEFILSRMFTQFARQRSAPGWEAQGAMALRRWIGLELGRRFEADASTGQLSLFSRVAA